MQTLTVRPQTFSAYAFGPNETVALVLSEPVLDPLLKQSTTDENDAVADSQPSDADNLEIEATELDKNLNAIAQVCLRKHLPPLVLITAAMGMYSSSIRKARRKARTVGAKPREKLSGSSMGITAAPTQ